jgi:hypothetical protein
VARIPVELSPAVAATARDAEDRRFTKGAIKNAVRWAAGAGVTSATVTELAVDTDPPTLVAELHPSGDHVVLYAGESAWTREPQWVHRVEVPAGIWELDWLRSRLVEEAAALGTDLTPAATPEVERSSDDLGQGETRTTHSVAWHAGPAHITAQVDEHEIYDGATPAWGSLRGRVDGLPGGTSITVTASLSVGRRTATVTVSRTSPPRRR